MKAITAIFGAGVAGIVLSLIMTIVTAVQQSHEKSAPPPANVPVPAIGQ